MCSLGKVKIPKKKKKEYVTSQAFTYHLMCTISSLEVKQGNSAEHTHIAACTLIRYGRGKPGKRRRKSEELYVHMRLFCGV